MGWAIALGAIGAAVSTVGLVAQGESASKSANYSAQVARNNAVIAEQNAAYSAQAGTVAATASSQRGAANLAKIKVAQAAGNIDVNSGSATAVRASQAETNKLDTETTAHNALLSAYGYRTQATSDTAQAGLLQNEADAAPIGAGLSAAGGLLGQASSLGFKWQDSQNPKTPAAGG